MNTTTYNKIERNKYKGTRHILIYALFAGTTLLVAIFRALKLANSVNDYKFLTVVHSALFVQTFLAPFLIATMTSKSVEIENQGDMWKILLSTGYSLKDIYRTKLNYLLKTYTLYHVIIWFSTVVLCLICHVGDYIPFETTILIVISSYATSCMLIIFHYNLMLFTGKSMVNLSVAIIGTLLAIASLLILPISPVPYAWYAMLSVVEHAVNNGQVSIAITKFTYYPLVVSTLLSIVIYRIGEEKFTRRLYD